MLAMLLWARSYYVTDAIQNWDSSGTQLEVYSGLGIVRLQRCVFFVPSMDCFGGELPPMKLRSDWTLTLGRTESQRFRRVTSTLYPTGFHFHVSNGRSKDLNFSLPEFCIVLPHWCLALIFTIVPAYFFQQVRRRRRREQSGLCRACGYDLRATPNLCPECGIHASRPVTS
jgi:hypothetical protein